MHFKMKQVRLNNRKFGMISTWRFIEGWIGNRTLPIHPK